MLRSSSLSDMVGAKGFAIELDDLLGQKAGELAEYSTHNFAVDVAVNSHHHYLYSPRAVGLSELEPIRLQSPQSQLRKQHFESAGLHVWRRRRVSMISSTSLSQGRTSFASNMSGGCRLHPTPPGDADNATLEIPP